MKLRRMLRWGLVLLAVLVGLTYTRVSLRRASRPPEPARTPSLDDAPARLYGLVEPLGREIYVGPLQPRRVVELAVREGDRVKAGDILCRLDDDVERQALRVAQSKLEEILRQLDITRDELRRTSELARSKAVPEFELSQLELRARLQERQAQTARAEIELRKTEIEKLILRAPTDAVVYTFDVRLGEHLLPADYRRIVLGSERKQVRLFVETFWLDRVAAGDRFCIRSPETLRDLGIGVVESSSPYVGARDFRTEDRLERFDTKYAQAILRVEEMPKDAPIGLLVLCERLPNADSRQP